MDARSILGVSALRPTLLVDVSTAKPREAESGDRVRVVTTEHNSHAWLTTRFHLDDDVDDDEDDDDDDDVSDGDDDDDDDDEDEDDEDEDVETWQVSPLDDSR